jgi:hypothetical protein
MSGISTMAARSPAEGAGAADAGVVVVAAAVAATAAATSYCGPADTAMERSGSPVAAAPPAVVFLTNVASSAQTCPT